MNSKNGVLYKQIVEYLNEQAQKNDGVAPTIRQWNLANGAPCAWTALRRISQIFHGSYSQMVNDLGYKCSDRAVSTRFHAQRLDQVSMIEMLKKAIIERCSYDETQLRDLIPSRYFYDREFGSYEHAFELTGLTRNHIHLLQTYTNYDVNLSPITFVEDQETLGHGYDQEALSLIAQTKDKLKNGQTLTQIRNAISPSVLYRNFSFFKNLIIAAGGEVSRIGGLKYLCSDYHMVGSHPEFLLDNWLQTNGFFHEIQFRYPNMYKFTADFKVGNVFIELTGAKDMTPDYRNRMELKKTLTKKHGLVLFEMQKVAEEELNSLREVLSRNR